MLLETFGFSTDASKMSETPPKVAVLEGAGDLLRRARQVLVHLYPPQVLARQEKVAAILSPMHVHFFSTAYLCFS